ncbi:MAG: 2-amino-4-hydroxy-6-hydroxymethyldihydropteridine diphosphokinase [Burkholderiales bacterium]|nr:2-amino-4-hydroxy-6-hydroxymethyldihydropteridine diphosphokinase [Burkholderiales bacterium]
MSAAGGQVEVRRKNREAQAFIALGSNLADPRTHIEQAFDDLRSLADSRFVRHSSLYRSAPVGYTDQPDFINAVAEIATTLAPQALLTALLDIEKRHGRVREFVNSPRTLDLDLLLYGDLSLNERGLILPHPRMHDRAFVLVPLAEIAPDTVIPGIGGIKQQPNCNPEFLIKLDNKHDGS